MTVAKQGMDTHANNLAQAMVDAYIRSGRYFEHVKEIIPAYREQLHTMLDGFRFFRTSWYAYRTAGRPVCLGRAAGSMDTLPLLEKKPSHEGGLYPRHAFLSGRRPCQYPSAEFFRLRAGTYYPGHADLGRSFKGNSEITAQKEKIDECIRRFNGTRLYQAG